MLSLKQLEFSRPGSFHLGPIDIQVQAGELTRLLGRNGSGKSTLLNLISGRLKPLTGELVLKTKQIASIGLHPNLFSHWSIQENFDWLKKLSQKRVELPKSIEPYSIFRADGLSSGQRRFCELAMLFALEFDLYLLDEAYNHLDVEGREFLKTRISELSQRGKTLIMSMHQSNDFLFEASQEIQL